MRHPIVPMTERESKVLTKMKKFILAGMPASRFTEELYGWFRNMYGHIAHYDRGGFFATWFGDNPCRAEFLKRADIEANCCRHWTAPYPEKRLEQELAQWIRSEGLVEKYERASASDLEATERAELERLKAKYEKNAV